MAAIILCMYLAGILIQLDSASVTVSFSSEDPHRGIISYAFYDCTFQAIENLKLIQQLPEEHIRRTNGGDTDRMLVGHFKGDVTGDKIMFIYK